MGKTELKGKDLLVNVAQTKPKTKEDAKLETHKDFIDIQIPLSGTEIMGYTAAKDCVPEDAPYNAEKGYYFLYRSGRKLYRSKTGYVCHFSSHKTDMLPESTPDGVKKKLL